MKYKVIREANIPAPTVAPAKTAPAPEKQAAPANVNPDMGKVVVDWLNQNMATIIKQQLEAIAKAGAQTAQPAPTAPAPAAK